MGDATAPRQEPAPLATRERIKAVAGELYVLRGHDGFSFADIAAAIGTTRANIHHHFGNKRRLMAELIDGFAADAGTRIARVWTDGSASFAERMTAQVEDLRRFYDRFNPRPGDRNVWSPLARLRLDVPALGALAHDALERTDRLYDRCLRETLAAAIAAGEFVPEMPVDDVVCVLRVALRSCPPMTQDSGSFADVERFLLALARTVAAAWGRRGGPATN